MAPPVKFVYKSFGLIDDLFFVSLAPYLGGHDAAVHQCGRDRDKKPANFLSSVV